MSKKLYVVDGSAFIFRAYYAIPELNNSKGLSTNAVYGFISILNKLIQDHNPEYLAICFDRKEPTFRKKIYKKYKANRDAMPEDLAEQIPYIKKVTEGFNIPLFEKAGFEADDLMGTLAKAAEKKNFETFLVTSDKDILQLVNEKTKVLNVHKDNLIYDIKKVKERYQGLGPEKVVDLMGLMGDTSDNIPGVPGVGEKTAIKLLSEFGSFKDVFKNSDSLKGALKTKIEENKDLAEVSRELVTIDCKAPIDFSLEDLKFKEKDVTKLKKLYTELEFRSLLNQLGGGKEAPQIGKKQKGKYQAVITQKALKELTNKLLKQKAFAVDTETNSKNPHEADLLGISVSFKENEGYYIPVVKHPDAKKVLSLAEVRKSLNPVFENPKIKKYGQNIKYDFIVLTRHDFALDGIDFDTMVASYLLNSGSRNHGLDAISLEHLGIEKVPYKDLVGEGKKQVTLDQVSLDKVSHYACEDADCVFQLVPIFEKLLKKNSLLELFKDLEMPLITVLGETEMNGVNIDTDFLSTLSKEAAKDLKKLEKTIHKLAGEEFNINSPKQLSEILFEKLKLPVIKKTKTGYSTDVNVLEKLSSRHELPKHLLEYREVTKLKSTYVDALPELVNSKTKLVHTSFNQTVTTTGRLSSSDPNFQNIPIKTEAGRRIREAFTPRKKSNVIIAADYSQIELRILAHLSNDKNLVKAFNEGLDVHSHTASLLYDVSMEDVDPGMRNAAKTINFSVIYGKTAFGLSQDLGMPINEASDFIDNYFDRYSGVKKLLDSIKKTAHSQGFTETMMGRRCYFPEINSKNKMRQQFAERAAINAPIQGSAADLIKIAMIDIQNELKKQKVKSKMILQVHDELVFDVESSEKGKIEKIVQEGMEKAMSLKVPLVVGINSGKSWAESK